MMSNTLVTYLRLLDADAEGADWREVTRVVLHLDPEQESDRARRGVRKPFVACQWMTEHGYRHLLRRGLKAVLMRNPGLACLSGRKCLSVEVHFASLGGVQRHV